MLRAGLLAEQLAVSHVRQPRQRMPVARRKSGERPAQAVPGQPRFHMIVAGHIKRVIEKLMKSKRATGQ